MLHVAASSVLQHISGRVLGGAQFVLVSTVYAVAVSKPNFGVIGPFAVGISLWASGFIVRLSCVTALSCT